MGQIYLQSFQRFMGRSKYSILYTAALIFVVFLSSEGIAQNTDNTDWQFLFNGKDLTGWQLLNGQHEVNVRDGVIVGTCIAGIPNGFLATTEEYGDFILELEVKADLLLHNSGIQFRSLSNKGYRDGRVHGYQAEIDVTPQKWSGGIYDEARRGWLYILEDDTPAKEAFKNNQWNHYRIEAIGTTNRVWVNGIPTSHLVDDMTTRGLIALQLHGNSRPSMPKTNHNVYFRNIKIKTKDLEPSPYDDTYVVNWIPNHLSGQEKHQGFSLLWNARNLDGWHAVDTLAAGQGWHIEEGKGILKIDPGSKNAIQTEGQYGPFELKFDFMQHEEGGRAGINYLVSDSDAAGPGTYGRLAAQRTEGAGKWNKGLIRVHPGGAVEYWLNGYKMLEYHLGQDHSIKGHLRLEGTDSPISYRSIKLKPLD